ncbi:MAG: sulfurtransferase TusA family protein, partial [Anaerovorax sp.]
MTIVKVDARGCACPEPVLKVKRAMNGAPDSIEVLVDNNTAVQNITRFATGKGCKVEVTETDAD